LWNEPRPHFSPVFCYGATKPDEKCELTLTVAGPRWYCTSFPFTSGIDFLQKCTLT
jgi:hypothetical protein